MAAARNNETLDLRLASPQAELLEQQKRIRLTRAAWKEFVRMTSGTVPATPVAKCEAGEFLRRFRGE